MPFTNPFTIIKFGLGLSPSFSTFLQLYGLPVAIFIIFLLPNFCPHYQEKSEGKHDFSS
jgi:hypothetical protein